ncbi:MAG TPA: ABC transporter permease [Gemmatimonadales bacterium]|jgi:putative ABC transport system permease protein
MDTLLQDLRYAVRQLVKRPGFTAVAVLTLALGIGANTSIFSVVDALLLRALPYDSPDRIVRLTERAPTDPGQQGNTSYLNYLDWQAQASRFEAMGIYQGWHPALTGLGEAERIRAAILTAGVLDVFRVVPVLGRPMQPADNEPGRPTVVLVSHEFWQHRLGGDPVAVGRTITLNGAPALVIGVLPVGLRPPGELNVEVWANNALDPRDTRGSRYLRVMARLKPGVTVEQARAEMATISQRLATTYPATNAGMETVVTPLRDSLVGEARRPLLLLLAAAGLVLLIACGNLSNLLIVRGTGRTREFAMRTALGASRSRAMRPLLAEAVLLAVVGGAVGLLVAVWATPALLALGPESLRSEPLRLDWPLVGFALAAVVATAALAGLAPAIQASRVDMHSMLKEGVRGAGSRSSSRLRSVVTVGQLALALSLLCGAGLLIKSFLRLQRVDPGIRPDRVLTMSMNLPGGKYPPERLPRFFQSLLEGVGGLPGVQAAAVTSILPFGGDWDRIAIDVAGQPVLLGTDRPEADRYIVSPGYHATLGVPLREGRLLSEADRSDGPLVCLVDDVFARRIAPDRSPIGLRLRLPGQDAFATIVGVVGHVKHYGLDAASGGQVYMSQAQYPWRYMNLVVRTAGDPLTSASAVRAVVRGADPDQPVYGVATMDRLMGDRTASRRFVMILLGLFAAVALALAGLGLYGVVAYVVSQRTREIGIRIALGAQAGRVARMVIGQGAAHAAGGIVLGLGCAVAVTRVLSGLLFDVSATDPIVFAVVAIVLLGVTLLASWLPSRRAARTDPMIALRSE